MKVKVEGNKMVIEIEMQKPASSSTGKTLVVASTRGNVETEVKVNGKSVFIGLNAYIKP